MKLSGHIGRLQLGRKENYMQNFSARSRPTGKNTTFNQELESVAQEFESLFTHQMLRQMRTAIPKSDFLDGGNAENIFTDLLDQEIGKIVSKRGIGIADVVYTQLQRD